MGTLTVTVTVNPNPNPSHNPNISSSLLPPKPYRFSVPFNSRPTQPSARARVGVWAYMERNPNSIGSIASKVIGSLPVVGLLARILSDEGGVAGDVIDFAEFRRRVGKMCGVSDSRAFYEFQDRRGRKRAKLKAQIPEIPMELRVEKALEAVYVCCFGRDPIEVEDVRLLSIMLNAVFPLVGKFEIDRKVSALAKRVADGEKTKFPEPKTLSKEAVQRQMKDLQFLKQNKENSS